MFFFLCAFWLPQKTIHPASPVPLEDTLQCQLVITLLVLNEHQYTNSVDNMLYTLNWPSRKQQQKTARLTMFFKIITGQALVRNPEIQQLTKARRGHDRGYRQMTCHTELRRSESFPKTIRDRDNLPADTVYAPSVATFILRVSSLWGQTDSVTIKLDFFLFSPPPPHCEFINTPLLLFFLPLFPPTPIPPDFINTLAAFFFPDFSATPWKH